MPSVQRDWLDLLQRGLTLHQFAVRGDVAATVVVALLRDEGLGPVLVWEFWGIWEVWGVWWVGGPRAEAVAAQQGGESPAEVCVEGVDDRVERGVGPAEPHEDVEGGGADAGGGRRLSLAERNNAVEDEERQPAADKYPHDDRQGLKHLGLPLKGHLEGALAVHTATLQPTVSTGCRPLKR